MRPRCAAKYLRALEDEEFDILLAQTYVKGFLRTYAEYLGSRRPALRRRVQLPLRQGWRRRARWRASCAAAGEAGPEIRRRGRVNGARGHRRSDRAGYRGVQVHRRLRLDGQDDSSAREDDEEGPDAQDRGEVGFGADPGDSRMRNVVARVASPGGRQLYAGTRSREIEDFAVRGLAADRRAGERDLQRERLAARAPRYGPSTGRRRLARLSATRFLTRVRAAVVVTEAVRGDRTDLNGPFWPAS